MSKVQIILDISMCMLWVTTYILVLIGTIKCRYPLISPITQAIIAPFEWSVLFLFHKLGMAGFNYAFIVYLCWAIIEIVIFYAIEKLGYIKKRYIKPYIVLILVITLLMLYLVAIKEYMFFFSYFNTFLGVFIWAKFIRHKDYPINGISLSVFIMKFLADILGAMVYFRMGSMIISLLSVFLPVLDFYFILIYIVRKKKIQKEEAI